MVSRARGSSVKVKNLVTDREHLERYAVFLFGVIFLVAMIVLIIWIPKPTAAQFFVFRLTLALAASGVGALIPGFIELRQPLPHKGLLRAGGALALFLLVWNTNPAKFAIEGIVPPPIEDARKIIEKAIHLTDQHDYASAYTMYSSKRRASISEETFSELIRNTREPLRERTKGPYLLGGNSYNEYMGDKGPFVGFGYLSRFSGDTGVWAEAASVIAEDGVWKMYSHTLVPCVIPNCIAPMGF